MRVLSSLFKEQTFFPFLFSIIFPRLLGFGCPFSHHFAIVSHCLWSLCLFFLLVALVWLPKVKVNGSRFNLKWIQTWKCWIVTVSNAICGASILQRIDTKAFGMVEETEILMLPCHCVCFSLSSAIIWCYSWWATYTYTET